MGFNREFTFRQGEHSPQGEQITTSQGEQMQGELNKSRRHKAKSSRRTDYIDTAPRTKKDTIDYVRIIYIMLLIHRENTDSTAPTTFL